MKFNSAFDLLLDTELREGWSWIIHPEQVSSGLEGGRKHDARTVFGSGLGIRMPDHGRNGGSGSPTPRGGSNIKRCRTDVLTSRLPTSRDTPCRHGSHRGRSVEI